MDAPHHFIGRLLPRRSTVDDADWDALYADQLPRLYNFLRYRVGPDDAEDLAARVFEKAWTKRHRYRREIAAFGTWLLSIARNEAIDHLRKSRRHEPLDETVTTNETPEDRTLRGQQSKRLRSLLAQLGDRERELIALKYGAGLGNRQIAELMGLGESHVGTLLHRTIRALRSQWEKGERHGR